MPWLSLEDRGSSISTHEEDSIDIFLHISLALEGNLNLWKMWGLLDKIRMRH